MIVGWGSTLAQPPLGQDGDVERVPFGHEPRGELWCGPKGERASGEVEAGWDTGFWDAAEGWRFVERSKWRARYVMNAR